MNNIAEFLSYLCNLDIKIRIEENRLRCSAPKDALTPAIKAELSDRKAEIIEFLRNIDTSNYTQNSIQPLPRTQNLPLSFSQQRLWFIDQLAIGSHIYNIPTAIHLKGFLNVVVLERTLNEIVRRHEVLRTTFTLEQGQPIQVIHPTFTRSLPVINLQELPPHNQQAEVQRLINQEALQRFNLTQGPLLRCTLLQLGEKEHVVMFTMHHTIADGWSMGVLIREIAALYEAFSQGQASPLPELPIQYADFAVWQRQWLQGEVLENHLTYWKQQLSGMPVLQLPTDHSRPAIQTFRGAKQSFSLSTELTEALKTLSRNEDATIFMTLLAAFQTLLHRYSGQDHIVVGSPIANRNRNEIEQLIGCFVNTLVLNTDFSDRPSFRELLRRVREVTLAAYSHQDLPFDLLLEELQPQRDLSHTPLFQVMFVLQNAPMSAMELSGLNLSVLENNSDTAMFDLTLYMEEKDDKLVAALEYNTDLFEQNTITRMIGHLQTLLAGIVNNPELRLSELPLLTEPEQHQLLKEWNNTQVDYPQDRCIHQLFELQVERSPHAIAVVFENQQLTYQQLNASANQLAHHLRSLGVGPDVLVGICVERSLFLIIGLLGILKAGGAYVPLDPTYPQERLAFMLADANLSVLLTQQHLTQIIPATQVQVICLDTNDKVFATESTENPVTGVKTEHLAYIIYTSGSTGTPKGVMNTHLGLCNRLLWMQDAYQLTPTDRVLQKTPFSFDVSVWEFFWPLLTGAILVLAEPEGHRDANYLAKLINQQQITTLHFVPSMLQAFLETPELDNCQSIKRVICSGEALSFDLQQRFFEHFDTQLYNLYGPTEASIDVTAWQCQRGNDEKIMPIGRPIANIQIYILDKYLQPLPIGVKGELHIGGVGLARGYLNRPELTKEKFIASPFESGKRLYKSGDLARYRPDGNIEYLGRIDHQVKIRGFRIELGEIEAALTQHLAVRETIVIAREDDPGNNRLVAYIVPDQKYAFPILQLLRFQNKSLFNEELLHKLPNGIMVAHLNKNETEFVYKELWEEQTYLKHGITINEGDCVFDVGANIGLFTLFVGQICKDVSIYAFEPIPPVFDLLHINTENYGLNVKLFNLGLSSETKSDTFTYYPQISVISGRFADAAQEREVIKSFLLKQQNVVENETEVSSQAIDELLAERLQSQQFTCQLRTISDVIGKYGVEKIDLLKIDVEKSEQDVLSGIQQEDWQKIKQIVVEVHNINGRLEEITALLKKHGYDLTIEQDALLEDTVLYNIYAKRPSINQSLLGSSGSGLVSDCVKPTWINVSSLLSEVRHCLQKKLPDYMIPASFIILEALPLTPNGKVDHRALPAPDQIHLELEKAFIAPQTTVEKQLADIWARVLGLEKIGIKDNFFKLGGDSILSIQVVSQASQAGLHLTVKQLFQHQTIAELAAVCDTSEKISAEQGIVIGAVPLTPIQQWFFEQNLLDAHHFNQSVLLEVQHTLDIELLKQAVQELLRHHDALRLRFEQVKSGWQQFHAQPDDTMPFSFIDLSTLSPDQQKSMLEMAIAELQASLNLTEGPLIRVAFFDLGAEKTSRLLLAIHHLVVDGVSWRTLIAHLETVYGQLSRKEAINLPAKTTSFKEWSQRIQQYSNQTALQQELNYWLTTLQKPINLLPVDYPEGSNTLTSARSISTLLSVEETKVLLQNVPTAYRAQINDVLLTALVQAFFQWTGEGLLLINLEGHGREDIFDDVDLSRTIGWFTSMFPVLLDVKATSNLGKAIGAVKEQLRAIPNCGIGYGLLRYLNENIEIRQSFATLSQPQVVFNYLGQFDQTVSDSSLFALAQETCGGERSLQNNRSELLDINSFVTNGRLQIDWTYSEKIHRESTIAAVAQEFVKVLRSLIIHCKSPETEGYVPSDFPTAKKLNQQQLDHLLQKYQQIEDIYPLSSMQEGMLFHTLYNQNSEAYFFQTSCILNQNLNLAAFKQAWQQVIERHAILRTAFFWERLDTPLQVILKHVDLPYQLQDWRGLAQGEQQARLDVLLKTDRHQGFNITTAPLMRLILIQLADHTYQFIWSNHHLLLDGWSVPLLLKEVFSFYKAFCQNQNIQLKMSRPYRDYIAWLQQQDISKAEAFWRQTLTGISTATPLPLNHNSEKLPNQQQNHYEQEIKLSIAATAALESLVRQHQLTLNTVFQGVWALLLSYHSGEPDVVFGATVSGRPPTLVEAESMIGLFINTMPVRVSVSAKEFLFSWLKQIQDSQVEARQYEYSSLVKIHEWSEIPRNLPLFNSIVVFENYPVDASLQQENIDLQIQNIFSFSRNHYPLTFRVVPGLELSLQIMWVSEISSHYLNSTVIARMTQHLKILLCEIGKNPHIQIQKLLEILAATDREQEVIQKEELKATDLQKLKITKRKTIRNI